jgi:hypothetical protein
MEFGEMTSIETWGADAPKQRLAGTIIHLLPDIRRNLP